MRPTNNKNQSCLVQYHWRMRRQRIGQLCYCAFVPICAMLREFDMLRIIDKENRRISNAMGATNDQANEGQKWCIRLIRSGLPPWMLERLAGNYICVISGVG